MKSKMKNKQIKGNFGIILYSKITDEEYFRIYIDNLHSFFNHLLNSELIKRIYFVDDSDKKFQDDLRNVILDLIKKTDPEIEIIDIIDNKSIYNAVNRVWAKVEEKYVINFQSDYRLIQVLPLGIIKKTLEKYPDIYSVHIVTGGEFGYSNPQIKQEIKRKHPYYKDFRDKEMETWFCFNEGKVYTLSQKLYLKQKKGVLPKDAPRGIELIPRVIDEKNTLWVPEWPAKILKNRGKERFTGGPCVFRSEIIKKYLPLPGRYIDEETAECAEGYFLKTDIDCKYYSGYLNLQAFAVQYKDPERPLWNVEKEYWKAYLQQNSMPVFYYKIKDTQLINISKDIPRRIQFFVLCRYCCLKSFLRWRFENLAIFLLGKPRAKCLHRFFRDFFQASSIINQKEDIKFSSITVTYNDALHLDECLKALSFCDEKIVIDLGSEDESVEIAKRNGAKIFYHKRVDIVEEIREYAIGLVSNCWIVFVDPDEIFPIHSIDKMTKIINSKPNVKSIAIRRRNYFLGSPIKYGRWHDRVYYIRVFHRKAMTFSKFVHRGMERKKEFRKINLKGCIMKHYWVDSMEEFYRRQTRYLKYEGESRYKNNKRFSYIGMYIALIKMFLNSYIKRLGFLDRKNGWSLVKLALWYEKNAWIFLKRYQNEKEKR
ncbi:MAG: glycosyltransferase family 2 protein [Candidatus Nealsonbacteria bacterium]